MKRSLLLAGLLATLPGPGARAETVHGATYQPPPPPYTGPGDRAPGSGSAPPPPAGPSGPGGANAPPPATPAGGASPGGNAGTPGAGAQGPSGNSPTSGGFDAQAIEHWTLWWYFNQAPYLDLKRQLYARATVTGSDDFFLGHGAEEAAHDSLRPSAVVVHDKVAPALITALRRETSPDILTSCLVALGKLGERPGESASTKAIFPFLARGNQEIAETAALSLGILGGEGSAPILAELLFDSERGQELVRSSRVPLRTRAFAAFGLGLVGHRTADAELRRVIAAHLIDVLEGPDHATHDLKAAAISALGIVPIEVRPNAPRAGRWGRSDASTPHVISRRTQIAYLLGWLDPREMRRQHRAWQVQAHAPAALARLLPGAPDAVKEPVVRALMAPLRPYSKAEAEIQQGCVIALGEIGDADLDETDAAIRERLEGALGFGDARARRFALIALGQIGGRPGGGDAALAGAPDCSKVLLETLARGASGLRPWAALGVGILGRALIDVGDPSSTGLAESLLAAARGSRRPQEVGAYSLALGVQRHAQGGELLLEKLREFSGDEARGHISVALGLLRERKAIGPITELVRESEYRPELLSHAAVGLGLMGDKDVVGELIEMLRSARGTASQASCATALGIVGDVRSIDPLLEMLGEGALTETARAFAAVALGSVCEKEDLPWNAKLAVGANYLAATPTMVGEGRGVLEIL